ncbi:hypothetical protein KUW09_14425 [Mameliella alba]|nr:hypothetical protein [Antarctobacter heliothermus]MBY6145249.1 hypothetical protein [Mameliella alba]MCA0954997.1 hypothetical protein [Mameliella alba]
MTRNLLASEIALVSASELAEMFGFASPNDAFRAFCRRLGVTPIRRNPHFFDAKLVRLKLDKAQGLPSVETKNDVAQGRDLIALRRARNATR